MWENGTAHLINCAYVCWILPGLSSTIRPMPSACQQKQTPQFDLTFMGTGTSGSVPNVSCLTAPPGAEPCHTCLSTRTPEGKKNIRRNTSAVVRIDGADGRKVYAANFGSCIAPVLRLIIMYLHLRTILIDAGKNFQAAALEWFPKYGLRRIDAVLLTHGHADGRHTRLIPRHIAHFLASFSHERFRRLTRYVMRTPLASPSHLNADIYSVDVEFGDSAVY